MAHGRASWLTRAIGLVLARRALWRALAAHGPDADAVVATLVSNPKAAIAPAGREAAGGRRLER